MLDDENVYGFENNEMQMFSDDISEDIENEIRVNEYQIDRRIKQSRLKRKVRKSRYNLTVALFFARIFLICAISFVIINIFRLKYWVLNPHTFDSLNNQSIKIENNLIVSSDKILRAIKQNEVPSCPIFLLNTDEIKKSILEITPIQNVYIKRYWFPARLEILVQEREPAIVIAPNETVPPIAFYTKDGTLVGRGYLPLSNSFKTVKVLTYGYNPHSKFDKNKIEFLLTIAKDIENASKETVQYIDYRNPDDIYVQIPTVNIKLGSISPETYPDTRKKIYGLPSILPRIKLLDKKVKYLDLRWQNNLYYIKLAE